jgi:pyrroloquinoline quinone biosynthesis protein D
MLDKASRPRLTRGCRLRATDEGYVLLMPESLLRMNGPGSEILKRCDGEHSVEQILAELQSVYSAPDSASLGAEVESFLTRLLDKRAIQL